MKKALIGTALVIGMIGSAAAATNCSSFPNNVVTGNVNDRSRMSSISASNWADSWSVLCR